MQNKCVNSIQFGAQIRFVSTSAPKRKKTLSSVLGSVGTTCKTVSGCPERAGALVFALPAIIKKIVQIKNSIKLPT